MKKVEREKVSWECKGRGPRNIPGRSSSVPGLSVCGGRLAALCLLVKAPSRPWHEGCLQAAQNGHVQVGEGRPGLREAGFRYIISTLCEATTHLPSGKKYEASILGLLWSPFHCTLLLRLNTAYRETASKTFLGLYNSGDGCRFKSRYKLVGIKPRVTRPLGGGKQTPRRQNDGRHQHHHQHGRRDTPDAGSMLIPFGASLSICLGHAEAPVMVMAAGRVN